MIRTRRRAREAALQALYQSDTLTDWTLTQIAWFFERYERVDEDGCENEVTPDSEKVKQLRQVTQDNVDFSRHLAFGVAERLSEVDQYITAASTHWSIARMARVDRNILRLAVYEMACLENVPVNVSINEAIEIAKVFGSDESPMFINGVLDNVAKEFAKRPEFAAIPGKFNKNKIAAAG